jgi:hypothetical protein
MYQPNTIEWGTQSGPWVADTDNPLWGLRVSWAEDVDCDTLYSDTPI